MTASGDSTRPGRRKSGGARRNLLESEERFRLLVESVRDYAIFMLDTDGRVATWNAGAERIKGYRADEIIGSHFSRFYPSEAVDRHWPDEELRLARLHGRFEDEGWRLRKDGSRFWANVVITALLDRQGKLQGYAKVTRDLTERKLAEERLQAAQADLERRVEERTRELAEANEVLHREIAERQALQAERERLAAQLEQRIQEIAEESRHKSEFLAMLGHELRNPLAPIRNALEILKVAGAGEEGRRKALAMIERQVQHLVRVVDDLLDVSRIMQGKIELHREAIDVGTVLARATDMAQPAIEAGGHHFTLSLPAEPVRIAGDLVRLTQVVSNLLLNAAKYTPRGGRIELAVDVEGDWVTLRVRDTGIGIPLELQGRIFDFFVQGERQLARSQGGLGIGLTLVRRLVELHGGEVTVQSAGSGQGSEFGVRLPLADGIRPPDRRASTPPPDSPESCRVLVVDDNVDAAESTAALVELWGHRVRTVHDGAAVKAAVLDFRPDVILLDIGLPGKDGFEVAGELRGAGGPPIRVMAAMTGYGQPEDRARSAAAGFDVHLTKPLDPAELKRTIERAASGVPQR